MKTIEQLAREAGLGYTGQGERERISELEAQNAQLLEACKLAEESLGAFVSDLGWSHKDLDTLDTLAAAIAAVEGEI